MMEQSYLEINGKSNSFQCKQSYIEEKNDNYSLLLEYSLLPEEYNVFMKLNNVDLSLCTKDQVKLFSTICFQITQTLKSIYHEYGVIKVLPKMEITIDDEKAIILNWPYNVYRVYFDIERNISSSFYGLIVSSAENNSDYYRGELCAYNKKYYSVCI